MAHFAGSCSIYRSQRVLSLGKQLFPSLMHCYFWILHGETETQAPNMIFADLLAIYSTVLFSIHPWFVCVISKAFLCR